MQADEFEKKIQNKMEGFGLVPDSKVWKQVAGRIEKDKKKRRVLFYWLFTGFALLAGTSALWFMHSENNRKLVINEVHNNVLKRENYKRKQNADNSENLSKVKKSQPPKSIRYLNKDNLKPRPATEVKINPRSKIMYTKVINRKRILSEQKEYSKVYKEEILAQISLPPHRFYNPKLAAPAKITAEMDNAGVDKNTNLKKDTSPNTAKETMQIKSKTSEKWHIGFTVYGGISDNVPGLLLMDKSLVQSDYSPGSIGNGNSNNSIINEANNYKSNFSSGFGIFVKKQVNKNLSLFAGIDYHLYNATSKVGNSVSSTAIIYNPINLTAASLDSYYNIVDSIYSTNYSNKYHLLELPLNLEYRINKNQEKPLLITAGISAGYLLSSNALYANPSANVYYVDKEKFHHFQLSAQSSLLFPISNSYKYLLNAGPVVQYGFTNAAKAVTSGSQHLFFTGLKANIILK